LAPGRDNRIFLSLAKCIEKAYNNISGKAINPGLILKTR